MKIFPKHFISSILEEMKVLIQLALPVIISQIGLLSMGFVDVMMVGHVGEEALAAVALGSTFVFSTLLVGMGILMGIDPLISQAYGAGNKKECGEWAQRGIVLSAMMTPPATLLFLLSPQILSLLGQRCEMIEASSRYIYVITPTIFFYFLYNSLRQFIQSLGIMHPPMVIVLFANGINAFANWVFIYGHLGFEPMGSTGAAYATSICILFMCLCLVGYMCLSPRFKEYPWGLRRAVLEWKPYIKLLSIGIPTGIQFSLEIWGFSAITFLMGWFGNRALAGHQIAMNFISLVFMIPLGIAVASAVRIGHNWGRQNLEGCRTTIKTSFLMIFGVAFLAALGMFCFSQWIASVYTEEKDLISTAASLLVVAAVFQFFDFSQVTGCNILRGASDTRYSMVVYFIGFWLAGLPSGYFLAFEMGMGPQGLWWGFVLGLSFVSSMLFLRIRYVFWKKSGRREDA